MADSTRPPHKGQLSDLPGNKVFVTGHNEETGKAILHSTRPVPFAPFDNDQMSMGVCWTTSFPSQLTKDADVAKHDELMSSGKLGLVNEGGTVCRTVDLAPGYSCLMHRTQSLDFGIVMDGTIEMILDSGDKSILKRGDVAVQRATMHQWRNVSDTEWARMIFVLQDCQKPEIGGKMLGEELGGGIDGLPASGNAH
ncbi:hypothetical protein MBLNU457_g2521t1 [Dothideomycetes sp. NU457]